MNAKTLVIIAVVAILGLVGFNIYSSYKSEARIKAMQAQADKAKSEIKAQEQSTQQQQASANANSSEADKAAQAKFNDIVNRWNEIMKAADSTPRKSLSPIISKLQGLRYEVQAITPGNCLTPAKEYLITAFDLTERGLTEFMESASVGTAVSSQAKYRERAMPSMTSYNNTVNSCKIK